MKCVRTYQLSDLIIALELYLKFVGIIMLIDKFCGRFKTVRIQLY